MDPRRPPTRKHAVATSHPVTQTMFHPWDAPRTFPKTIPVCEPNIEATKPMSSYEEEMDSELWMEKLVAPNTNKCYVLEHIFINLCRRAGRYLVNVSGKDELCFSNAVMAGAYEIYRHPPYPDFTDIDATLEAVGGERGKMTITVAGADMKLALELGIPVLVVDNSPRNGLSFHITMPTKVGVSHGMERGTLRDTNEIVIRLTDFGLNLVEYGKAYSDADVMNIIELLRGFRYQKEGNTPQPPDEAFLRKTIKEVILECLKNPWVLCIYHYGTHYQAVVVRDVVESLQKYPHSYPAGDALLPKLVIQEYEQNY